MGRGPGWAALGRTVAWPRLVLETGKPIAQVARELGINEGTLGNWCARERQAVAAGTAR